MAYSRVTWEDGSTALSAEHMNNIEEGIGEALAKSQGNADMWSYIRNLVYPVGSIYMSATLSTKSEVEALLGGTWEAWGSGRVPVGVDGSQTEFATSGKTGGSKSVALTPAQTAMKAHTHTYNKASTSTGSHKLTTSEIPAHTHGSKTLTGVMRVRLTGSAAAATIPYVSGNMLTSNDEFQVNYAGVEQGTAPGKCQMITIDASHTHNSVGGGDGHTHTVSTSSTSTGSTTDANGSAHTNLQPYITCYMYKRVS